jgi:hypothetical protein
LVPRRRVSGDPYAAPIADGKGARHADCWALSAARAPVCGIQDSREEVVHYMGRFMRSLKIMQKQFFVGRRRADLMHFRRPPGSSFPARDLTPPAATPSTVTPTSSSATVVPVVAFVIVLAAAWS